MNKNIPKIYPVIHFLNEVTAMSEAALINRCGADGLFLISHGDKANDNILPDLAKTIKQSYPNLFVGINLLSKDPVTAVEMGIRANLDGVWCDDAGVDSHGENSDCVKIKELIKFKNNKLIEYCDSLEKFNTKKFLMKQKNQNNLELEKFKLFASVAFKYQKFEENPKDAVANAIKAGFIPTTSGSGTGVAPSLDKISMMSLASVICDGRSPNLAVASGMTIDNVCQFTPHLAYILVATGVAHDHWHIDNNKLLEFIKQVRK